MAIIIQGVNGPFVGKLGPVVGYMWKGKACARAYRRDINYPNTPGQQRQRDWFVGMVRFASKAGDALRLGLRQKAADHSMTEGNYFVWRNKRCFRPEGGTTTVDYEHLELSNGPAADVYFNPARFEDNDTVTLTFEKNSLSRHASGSDSVYVYFYNPELECGYLSAPVERRSKTLRVRLPEQWDGCEIHMYGFVVDREGRASGTTYIGVGRVNREQERGRYVPINKGWKDFVSMVKEANGEEASPTPQPSASAPTKVDLFADMPLHSPPE